MQVRGHRSWSSSRAKVGSSCHGHRVQFPQAVGVGLGSREVPIRRPRPMPRSLLSPNPKLGPPARRLHRGPGDRPGRECLGRTATLSPKCDAWRSGVLSSHRVVSLRSAPGLREVKAVPWGPLGSSCHAAPLLAGPVVQDPTAAAAAAAAPQKSESGALSALQGGAKLPRFPAWCPQSDVRVFVGVTSRCCGKEVSCLGW